jgi:TPR repeat protein
VSNKQTFSDVASNCLCYNIATIKREATEMKMYITACVTAGLIIGLAGCGAPAAPSSVKSDSDSSFAGGCSSASACETLGVRYITGDGVKVDGTKAAYYLEKACLSGRASACNSAAFIYANAEGGARQDYTKAMKYWRMACSYGDRSGCSNYDLAQDKLDALRRSRR